MKVLVLTASAKSGSRSTRLLERFLKGVQSTHPQCEVIMKDLNANPPPHFGTDLHTAFTTKIEDYPTQSQGWSDRVKEMNKISIDLIAELKSSDLILVASPMYNWSIPSTLKCWLDNIIRQHYTFAIEGGKVVGLLGRPDPKHENYNPNKKVVVFVTSDASPADHVTKYLKATFGFIGITDFASVGVQFFDQDTNIETAYKLVDEELEKYLKSVEAK